MRVNPSFSPLSSERAINRPSLVIQPLAYARNPDALQTQVIAGTLRESLQQKKEPLIRGLSENSFQRLVLSHFSGLQLTNGGEAIDLPPFGDEFEDLVALLRAHCTLPDEDGLWLCHTVATAAMGENHLWQDLGLTSRKPLSSMMQIYFPSLAVKNIGDMKWKKFFYRQLCEQADVLICKSPHCAECCDYSICFGSEAA